MDKKKILAIFLAILAIVVILISTFTNNSKKNEQSKIYIVTNYSNFYTVSSCINRFVDYISNKESDNVFLILSDNYKKENKISKESVLNIFDGYLDNSYFEADKMYYQNINSNITKFYVYGKVSASNAFELSDNIDAYFIVYLDSSNKTFSVEPYNADSFKEVLKNGK
ncbi:MAG: hypothetical protein Q4E75_04040 [bacterium]|nr:hypothetical protein [bacterium]